MLQHNSPVLDGHGDERSIALQLVGYVLQQTPTAEGNRFEHEGSVAVQLECASQRESTAALNRFQHDGAVALNFRGGRIQSHPVLLNRQQAPVGIVLQFGRGKLKRAA